jgi:hypothetical protein
MVKMVMAERTTTPKRSMAWFGLSGLFKYNIIIKNQFTVSGFYKWKKEGEKLII